MVKYTDNAWHALKVAFANEIGAICKTINVDSHEVMDIFCKRHKAEPVALLSEARVRVWRVVPAQGLCARLNYKAKAMDVDVPVLNAILPSNSTHTERGIRHGAGERRSGAWAFSGFRSRPAPTICAKARW